MTLREDPDSYEELEWELEQQLEPENEEEYLLNNFEYYEDISPTNEYQQSFTWNEMSYNKFDRPTDRWSDDFEPEEYLLDDDEGDIF